MVVEVTVSVVVVVVVVAAIVVVGSSSSSKIVKYYLFFFLIFYLYEVFVTRFIQFLSFISPTVVIWNAQCEGNHFFDQFPVAAPSKSSTNQPAVHYYSYSSIAKVTVVEPIKQQAF